MQSADDSKCYTGGFTAVVSLMIVLSFPSRLVWGISLTALFAIQGIAVAEDSMITAHRGASDDAPENTLAAFRLAWQQGADAIEGDFRLSGDGVVVCIHDADTARTCGVKLPVADTPLARLRQLDYGRWKGEGFAGETSRRLRRCSPSCRPANGYTSS